MGFTVQEGFLLCVLQYKKASQKVESAERWVDTVLSLDVLNRGLRCAAIRIATGAQRFQIARFELQGQKPFESTFKISFKIARSDSLAILESRGA